jgi:enoyl-[acyl-carrier protein] reductase III
MGMGSYGVLQGKSAVITGSGRGIGRAIALELAGHGVNVAVNYFRHAREAEATANEVRDLGASAVVVKAHVGEVTGVQRLVETAAEAFGGVDIFVGNAASGVLKPVIEQEPKGWEWTVNINARSILFGAQAAAQHMMHNGWGRIIGITSFGSRRVLPEYSVVGVSKAAIEALIRYLAVEMAPHGIVCNAVSPGVVETDALNHFPSKDAILSEGLRRTPAGRFVTPEEVAKLVAWLCTDDARMIMGQTLVIDGGYELLA